jgi:LysM repeat protein
MTQLGRWPRYRTVRDFAIGGAVALVVVSSAVNLATFRSDGAAPALSDQSAVMQDSVARATTATQSSVAPAQPDASVVGASAAQPGDAGPLAVAQSDQIYVVQAGDTLYKIAAAYDTTVLAIVEENAMSDPDRLQVGQILTIPALSP